MKFILSASAFAIKPLAPSVDPLTHRPNSHKSILANPVFEGIVKLSTCSVPKP